MCIMFIYRNADASLDAYRIILVFNRDESLTRPTASAHWWEKYPGCLGGVDMEPGKEGGTWLAMSTEGRFGALLNLTGEKRPSTTPGKGRGCLVTDYLTSKLPANEYLQKLHEKNHVDQTFNPYNLVLVNLWNADVTLLCSAGNATGPQECADNILGFGNSAMNRPFKKVTTGMKKFESIVEGAAVSEEDATIKRLLQFLKWNEKHLPDPELESRSPNWYEDLSSIFVHIRNAAYGTRTHSILLVDGSNNITFVEDTLMPDASWKYQTFKTRLQTVS